MKHPTSIHDHVRIHTILFWLGVAIVVVGGIFSKPLQPHWLMWGGLAVFLSSFVYRLAKVRCPHCGSPFRLRGGIPKHCPNCGKYIDKFH